MKREEGKSEMEKDEKGGKGERNKRCGERKQEKR
jgi:hypothetical protein